MTSTLFWKKSQAESLAARLKKLAVIPTKRVKSKDQLIPLVDTAQVCSEGGKHGVVHGTLDHTRVNSLSPVWMCRRGWIGLWWKTGLCSG